MRLNTILVPLGDHAGNESKLPSVARRARIHLVDIKRFMVVRFVALALGATLLVGGAGSALAAPAIPAEVPQAVNGPTFAACKSIFYVGSSPSARNAKTAERQLKKLKAKQAKKVSLSLGDAESKKERRAAFKKASKWCSSQGAFQRTPLIVPDSGVFDTTTATISGTTAPGAVVTLAQVPTTADASGNFAIPVTGLVDGPNKFALRATAPLQYPGTATVTITKSVSPAVAEFALKSSAAAISYDALIKDPDAAKGQVVYSRAQVFQFDSRTAPGLLVQVTQKQPGEYEFWTDNVFLVPLDKAITAGIDNYDIIEFWGTVIGAFNYDTAQGGTNSVPSISVRYMNLIEKRDE